MPRTRRLPYARLAPIVMTLALAVACGEGSAPRTPATREVQPFAGPPANAVLVRGSKDGDPPPPPLDTLSSAVGSSSGALALAADGTTLATPTVTFDILHRATFTSNLEGTAGWMAWGKAIQPKGSRIEGYAEVYYGTGYLRGSGTVRISDAKGALTIDFAKHLDTQNATIWTACTGDPSGACAIIYYRGAAYTPTGGRTVIVAGRLLVGVPARQ